MSWRENAWRERPKEQSTPSEASTSERASKLFEAARTASRTPSSFAKQNPAGNKQFRHRQVYKDPFDEPLPDPKGKAKAVPSNGYEDDYDAVDHRKKESPPPPKSLTLHELLKLLTTPASTINSNYQSEQFTQFQTSTSSPTSLLTMREAMPVAGKLFSKGYNRTTKLAQLSMIILQELGIEGEEMRAKTLRAIKGAEAVPQRRGIKRASGAKGASRAGAAAGSFGAEDSGNATGGVGASSPNKRQRLQFTPSSIGKDWGDVPPSSSTASGYAKAGADAGDSSGELFEYQFNEVLEEPWLRGKYVLVNRAPVMTAWATVILEKLGFQTDEALSLGGWPMLLCLVSTSLTHFAPYLDNLFCSCTAHCYVNATSTARGVSIGVLPASAAKEKESQRVGTNQPHFELMGLRIPVMQLQNGAYRGISKGEVVGPDKAWNYLRNSMYQTLPIVMGALNLLADSYLEVKPGDPAKPQSEIEEEAETIAPPGPADESSADADAGPHLNADKLHVLAYSLYTEFRPETGGQWGKKATLHVDKILELRKHIVDAQEGKERDAKEDTQNVDTDLEGELAAAYDLGWNPDDLGLSG
ncbi:hypothetical protein K437DRAFT_258488 [Tilletiaria anomala UBC 951]|uniref:Uncharacterized protein n=1 Tax=Tilletiaria anomala (strain ATCC 24038 / CBS 436.72 / UBC 951) TaxID=1037660 RepID=A0A066VQP8_TILAU|nr:uncharacterized protein K437DRAFT_258488 [Tilletiaria anomala UBC 951]KDN40870.1 hypothetical protein K437DRAFT_258488 [Tilletiaria anomala UBC 951]